MITGSVLATPTVSAHTLTTPTGGLTFPQAGLTVVGIIQSSVYVSIPLDSSRNAILPNCGGNTAQSSPPQTVGTFRPVSWTINGTTLNYSVYSETTSPTICFYYGTPVAGTRPLTAFAGIATASTLSSGSATQTITFPSGGLTLNGVSATMGLVAASSILELEWATSSGQTFTAFIPANILTAERGGTADILPVGLTVAQTLTVSVSQGTGSDVIVSYFFYNYGQQGK